MLTGLSGTTKKEGTNTLAKLTNFQGRRQKMPKEKFRCGKKNYVKLRPN